MDEVIGRPHVHFFFCDRCAGFAFETMDVFCSIQFAPVVDFVATVDFLKKDDRNIRLMRGIHDAFGALHVVVIAGHDGNACLVIHERGFLDVDDQQDGLTDDGGLAWHWNVSSICEIDRRPSGAAGRPSEQRPKTPEPKL